jgi:hypothetical protein
MTLNINSNIVAVSLVVMMILCGSQTSQGKQNNQGVIVENTTANPVPVKPTDNPAFQPYARSANAQLVEVNRHLQL